MEFLERRMYTAQGITSEATSRSATARLTTRWSDSFQTRSALLNIAMETSRLMTREARVIVETSGVSLLDARLGLQWQMKPAGDVQRLGAPAATFAVKHDVVVIFPRRLYVKCLLKLLRGQLQGLLQVAH
ncbi:hypothetical protein F7725_029102 [Dissostichus mawsoni]|uniref:Uncharacterized protein n=1 Tax=Dissostichus mawsoni TaxID=36200 RepID=A0A7J5XHM4_DISMA|nr:hypothetical protein F7725_029102 [Dissostichus mawsoni]